MKKQMEAEKKADAAKVPGIPGHPPSGVSGSGSAEKLSKSQANANSLPAQQGRFLVEPDTPPTHPQNGSPPLTFGAETDQPGRRESKTQQRGRFEVEDD